MPEEKNQRKEENIVRQPVIVVLGHVDHGKSSLLEATREDFVITSKESGGITQHTGAYEAEIKGNPSASSGQRKITFIDTPGHEAFSAMRERGAFLADIALLVIDACDGVMPQTKEAIQFVKKAGLPMIVVFNKIDKPGADPEKVKGQLAKVDVLVESYGGKIPACNVSAKEKKGIEELLETILLVAEMEQLENDLESFVEGVVVESSLSNQKGPTTVLIVKKGILRLGDIVATDSVLGKVKRITDFQGRSIDSVLPGQPANVLGFEAPPAVGERFKFFTDIEKARLAVVKGRKEQTTVSVVKTDEAKKLFNIIVKTDVLGTAEAIENILQNLPQDKVILRTLKCEVGDITAEDIKLAESGKAKIFGFRVKQKEEIKMFAEQKKVPVAIFDVIYELVQEVRKAMTAVLEHKTKRIDIGKFKVSHIFKQTKEKQIIGGRVLEGEITREAKAEVIRDEEIISSGRIRNLQKEKQEIGKARKGQEVGLLFICPDFVKENDVLVIFREEKEKDTL